MKTTQAFNLAKARDEKIVMLTCYDYPSACAIQHSTIDAVLVGDTVSMVVHGHPSTTAATLEMMVLHTQAVARGLNDRFIVADMPFMSYRRGLAETAHAAEQLIRAGAQAIKLEGSVGNLDTIHHLVHSGIPVMGHIGLTPQHVNVLGGYKLQGRDHDAQIQLQEQAQALQDSGCFALVLECVPTHLAQTITQTLDIATIGIGAGPHTDGQILVWHDLLGLQTAFQAKFVKRYMQGERLITDSLNQYANQVRQATFPSNEHSYTVSA